MSDFTELTKLENITNSTSPLANNSLSKITVREKKNKRKIKNTALDNVIEEMYYASNPSNQECLADKNKKHVKEDKSYQFSESHDKSLKSDDCQSNKIIYPDPGEVKERPSVRKPKENQKKKTELRYVDCRYLNSDVENYLVDEGIQRSSLKSENDKKQKHKRNSDINTDAYFSNSDHSKKSCEKKQKNTALIAQRINNVSSDNTSIGTSRDFLFDHKRKHKSKLVCESFLNSSNSEIFLERCKNDKCKSDCKEIFISSRKKNKLTDKEGFDGHHRKMFSTETNFTPEIIPSTSGDITIFEDSLDSIVSSSKKNENALGSSHFKHNNSNSLLSAEKESIPQFNQIQNTGLNQSQTDIFSGFKTGKKKPKSKIKVPVVSDLSELNSNSLPSADKETTPQFIEIQNAGSNKSETDIFSNFKTGKKKHKSKIKVPSVLDLSLNGCMNIEQQELIDINNPQKVCELNQSELQQPNEELNFKTDKNINFEENECLDVYMESKNYDVNHKNANQIKKERKFKNKTDSIRNELIKKTVNNTKKLQNHVSRKSLHKKYDKANKSQILHLKIENSNDNLLKKKRKFHAKHKNIKRNANEIDVMTNKLISKALESVRSSRESCHFHQSKTNINNKKKLQSKLDEPSKNLIYKDIKSFKSELQDTQISKSKFERDQIQQSLMAAAFRNINPESALKKNDNNNIFNGSTREVKGRKKKHKNVPIIIEKESIGQEHIKKKKKGKILDSLDIMTSRFIADALTTKKVK